jgi:Leu/Phe-tRNA-protein transferase
MSHFRDPRYAHGDVVAVGNDLRVETLRDAYRHRIFPWPHENLPMPGFRRATGR